MIVHTPFKRTALIALFLIAIPFYGSSLTLFRVGASVPISYNATGLVDDDKIKQSSNAGVGLDVVLPLGWVFRLDNFVQKGKIGTDKLDVNSTFLSAGKRLDFVFFHLTGALGVGSSTISSVKDYKTANPFHVYLESGISIFPLFETYLAYHIISGGKIESKDGKSSLSSKLDATAVSIGFNFGF
ncbi:MAG: hypothetical protein JJV97_05625 [SAR324 cluster bacterium]|nr:hypothetical protein [SAR324 cluster bacterium]